MRCVNDPRLRSISLDVAQSHIVSDVFPKSDQKRFLAAIFIRSPTFSRIRAEIKVVGYPILVCVHQIPTTTYKKKVRKGKKYPTALFPIGGYSAEVFNERGKVQ